MMIPDRAPEKVTIEDLLRLKRAERPSPEFWTRFEQDLRAKQLAAIVERRPWWHALHLPQAARMISRFQVPVGSAAILALSFVVMNQYRPDAMPAERIVPEVSTTVTPVATNPVKTVKTNVFVPVEAAVRPKEAIAGIATLKTAMPPAPVKTPITANSTASSQPVALTAMIPWGVGQEEADTVSTHLLDAEIQSASLSNLSVASLLGNAGVAENQVESSRPRQVAEAKPAIVQASSPREVRRTKILAGLVLAENAEGSDYARAIHGRDIAANDLNDAQLYDSVRRLGVGGDRFTLKF